MPPAPIVVDEAEGDNMNEAQLINEVCRNLWVLLILWTYDNWVETDVDRSTRYGRRSELILIM